VKKSGKSETGAKRKIELHAVVVELVGSQGKTKVKA
jgi:hypothetical protein